MENPLVKSLGAHGLVFRTKDLNNHGLTNYQIGKMVSEGLIQKIYQGVYTIGDYKKMQITDINVIIENGIVSLTSAAFYYKLTDENEGKITITLNRDQKPPKVPFDIFSYYYTTSKFFDIGLKIVDQDGRQIKIYDVERTVCDVIRHRSKYDSQLIKEILENYLQREDADVNKLLEYAQQLRIYNVVTQYLEILGGLNVEKKEKND